MISASSDRLYLSLDLDSFSLSFRVQLWEKWSLILLMYSISLGVEPLISIVLYCGSVLFETSGAFWTPVEKEFINDLG
jgi:hypothetical protein